MRLPTQIDFGPYTIHLDVLAMRAVRQRARMQRWAVRLLGMLALIALLGGIAWGFVPWVRGTGTLLLAPYPAQLSLVLDEQPLPQGSQLLALRSGTYALTVQQTGMFAITLPLTISRDLTTTLTLPDLRPIPRLQPVTLPSSDARWQQISRDAGGGWRIRTEVPRRHSVQPGLGPNAGQDSLSTLLHLDRDGLSRLSILETYPIADELVKPSGDRYWASWQLQQRSVAAGVTGLLTLTTPSGTNVLTTTSKLRGLWWSPDGQWLLVAQADEQGQALLLVERTKPTLAGPVLMTIPAAVQSVEWKPDSQAVVVVSAASPEALPTLAGGAATPTAVVAEASSFPNRSALLIRMPARDVPTAMRLRAPPNTIAGTTLLAWSAHSLWWGTDTGLGLALDQIDLATGTSTRIGTLPDSLIALTALADHTMRIAQRQADGSIAITRWPTGEVLFTLPELRLPTSTPRPGGSWADGELLIVATPSELWYVQIAAEALR